MTEEKNQVPDKEELERRKGEIKNNLCCPHCGEKLSKWAVPHTLFTTWTNDFMYICFNDECNYLTRGFEAAAKMGNNGSYRLMYDPQLDCCQPVPVTNTRTLKEGIVDVSDEAQKNQNAGICGKDIAGTWKLVSVKMIGVDGQVNHPIGHEPQGMLSYIENGSMSVQNMPADGGLSQTSDGEVAALEAYGAYSGKYELVGGDKIIHHIENSIHPDWNNLKQERNIKIESDRLTLVSPLLTTDNKLQKAHMTWKKA